MLRTSPFLLFDGNCAEAMSFYHQCLGGALTLSKTGDTPIKDQFPEQKHERIIYAQLKGDTFDISAADWMASPVFEPQQGNTTAIYLTGSSYKELKPIFDSLADGADKNEQTFMELREVPFGVYGQLTDKYNVSWVFRAEAS
ncbi:VOC family protein [Dyadobacter sp. CY356]|uniref:VOC family protein n=1 Tax=Dyadobacter sp. CY356 TaxID=2906442 RepID=UPI001F43E47D|nr:VOC family protein [Dyadobacter sp. CY356]MCF0059087.1 VOC family protein [Dyadobacter sp. CY356]